MAWKINPDTGDMQYYQPSTGGGGGGATNLTFVPGVNNGVVVSDTGTDATILAANATNAGLMLAAEKTKLAAIAAGAEVNVQSDWNATSGDALILNKPTSLPTSTVKHVVKYGEDLTIGQAVYVSSADGTNMIVSKADYSAEITSSKTIGLIAATGVTNHQGEVITEGLLTGLNTSTATIGDAVWLGDNGEKLYGIANKPVAPNHLVFLGIVTRVHAVNGEIFVRPQNGFELDELHDVLISTPLNDHVIAFDSATGLWKNKAIASGGGGSTGTEANSTRSLPYFMGNSIVTYKSFMPVSATATSSLAFAGETVHFFPTSLKEGNTISSLAFRVYTAGSAGLGSANVEFAIYKSTTDVNGNLIPGDLEVAFGKVATNSTGVKEATLVSPHTLGATTDGIYFIAFRNYSTSSIQLNIHSTSDASTYWFGFSSSTAVVKLGCFYATCAYTEPDGMPAALPATGGVGFTPSTTVAGYVTSRVLAGIK